MGVPPVIILILMRFSPTKTNHFGVPPFMETPIKHPVVTPCARPAAGVLPWPTWRAQSAAAAAARKNGVSEKVLKRVETKFNIVQLGH